MCDVTIKDSNAWFPSTNLTVHPERDLTSSRAREFAMDLGQLHDALKEQISHAQSRYQTWADAQRLPAREFAIGSSAFFKAQFCRTTRPSKKLAEKFLGPFEIIARAGSHSYTLQLPDNMRVVHLGSHVSMLDPAAPNVIPNRVQSPPPPVKINGDIEYEIAEILDSKVDQRRRHCNLLYLVRWAGYEV